MSGPVLVKENPRTYARRWARPTTGRQLNHRSERRHEVPQPRPRDVALDTSFRDTEPSGAEKTNQP